MNVEELQEWFEKRPQWLQDAARRVFSGRFTAEDLDECVALCAKEAGLRVKRDVKARPLAITSDIGGTKPKCLRIESIESVEGINALAPRKPLSFCLKASLVVVYGENGTGKSGYIRILKSICGGRGGRGLLGNVFSKLRRTPKCKIKFSDGKSHAIEWTPEVGHVAALEAASLYDTDCAQVYVTDENEVTYEPEVLAAFTRLVKICEQVDDKLAAEIEKHRSRLPVLPTSLRTTTAGQWYEDLSATTKKEAIDKHCTWEEEQKQLLERLKARQNETNPEEKAKALRKCRQHLSTLIQDVETFYSQVNDEEVNGFFSARMDALSKRKTAGEDAERIFASNSLEGVGTDSWQRLWEAARHYSEQVAYKPFRFPHIDDDPLCVLCQQPLSPEAKERLLGFEKYVKGRLEKEAQKAEKKQRSLEEALQQCWENKDVGHWLDLAGITDEEKRQGFKAITDTLDIRRRQLLSGDARKDIYPLPNLNFLEALKHQSESYRIQIHELEDDAKADSRASILAQIKELQAQEWLADQKEAISNEIKRQKLIAALEKARRSTKTSALSKQKSFLADQLVTAAFQARFENELQRLGARRLKVTIVKTRTSKGHVWHEVQLVDPEQSAKAGDILSEGEFRVVSLAAFLADVTGTDDVGPLIFDDPISSLDQNYEERVATRLTELAMSRQVIVFTHRLSLLGLLEENVKKLELEHSVLSLRRESWGTGEPDELPLHAQKPKVALNALLNQRLSAARKSWEEEGSEEYQTHAKALCRDIRVTLERLIENDLLADVVQRFRRPINTLGKMNKLVNIQEADCRFLDEMMTKYSVYEHSQPEDRPEQLPEPDELQEDLEKLKKWQDEFSKR